jgi:hypothetical protein
MNVGIGRSHCPDLCRWEASFMVMSEEPDNLVLVYLRRIDDKID